LVSAEFDFSDICKWNYRRGNFNLLPEALGQMQFNHLVHPLPPKYVFPAAVLLFVCTDRTEDEEAAFQSLSREWDYWFDQPLSYDFLKNDPPKRLGLNSDEINWCKVRLDFLVKQIKSDSDRERLGLPTGKKGTAREAEAAALLPSRSARCHDHYESASQSSHGSKPAHDEAGTSAKSAADPSTRAAAAASVDGGDSIAEMEGGCNAEKTIRSRKRNLQTDAGAAGAPTKRFKKVKEEGTPVREKEKTTVRASDGKTVSLKDGRIVAAGNDLKRQYPNNYRNAENTNVFYGRNLTLGEAFKLACLVHYGPTLPIETSGHILMRTALFRTAAYYALTVDEEKEIRNHPSFADFLFFLVKSAKQQVYAYSVDARLIFGDAVFSRHPPLRLLRGTSNVIFVHYAETVFNGPLFSMQSIWAWQPTQPS
jgi:hypothetical protein